MKKLIIATYLFSLIFLLELQAQDFVKISGKVIDKTTGEPLLFATISIKGKSEGTITNLDGEFDFFVSNQYVTDTLTISHIGYDTYRTSIGEIIDKPQLEIGLSENIITLDEIQIEAERLTANKIMSEALENLSKNYATQPFVMKGFFRDLRDQNHQSAYLVEAAVEVYDPGIQLEKEDKKKKRKLFFIKGIRVSHNYLNELITPALSRQNWLTRNVEYEYWSRRLYKGLIANKKEYELEDIIYKGDKLLYVISSGGTAAKSYLALQHKDLRYEYINRYYIDTETYAIHKIEYLENPLEGIYVGIERPYEGDTLYYSKKGWNDVYEFEEYKGKMYLKYYSTKYAFDIYNTQTESVYLDLAFSTTFMVTDIEIENAGKPKGIRMNRNKSLILQATAYDSDFWSKESNVKLVPLTQKQIRGLERKVPLEEQFKLTGRRKK